MGKLDLVIFPLVGIFIISQLLGFYTGAVILRDYASNPMVSELGLISKAPQYDQNLLDFLVMIAAVLCGALFLLFLFKYYKGNLLFLFINFFIVAVPSSVVFYSFLRMFLPYEASTVAGMILGVALGIGRQLVPALRNPAVVLTCAGIGAIIGMSLTLLGAVAFLALLCVYDYIAVYKTKHMIDIAKTASAKEMPLLVSQKAVVPETKEPLRLDLGTGDVIAPIILGVSASSSLGGPAPEIFVLAGSSLALLLFLKFMFKKGNVYPALPPIFFGSALFLAVFLGLRMLFPHLPFFS